MTETPSARLDRGPRIGTYTSPALPETTPMAQPPVIDPHLVSYLHQQFPDSVHRAQRLSLERVLGHREVIDHLRELLREQQQGI